MSYIFFRLRSCAALTEMVARHSRFMLGARNTCDIVLKIRPVSEPVRWLTHWFTGPTGGSAGSIATKNY
jgi:hypothetical protein